ncbi:MAG TPA: cation diffusion facilitator family transporter [Pseudomonadota bacterium]|nr:cation diffusion facilitator family transporter [Pseudomonadota bacterium]
MRAVFVREVLYNPGMLGERERKSLWAVNLGLVANVVLSVLKTVVGVLGHSPVLLAEGINSTSDVAYSIIARIFVRMANKPADTEHPYGHRQLETIASLTVGAFIVATAIGIFWDAVDKIWDLADGKATSQGATNAAFGVALGTVALKIFLFYHVRRLAQETQNPVVNALARDHRNDVFSAAAASVGIFFGQRGLPWLDPAAGAFVALFILRTGVSILRESSSELMDAVPNQQLTEQVAELLRNIAGVHELQELLAHRFGPHTVINLTIGIDGALSLAEGDAIATRVEQVIKSNLPQVLRVHIHYHPTTPKPEPTIPQSPTPKT